MKTKAEIVEYLAGRLNGDAAECTHMTLPIDWLRVLIDLPAPPPRPVETPIEMQAESPASEESTDEADSEPTPPPAPKRRRKTNQTDSEVS